MNEVGKPAQRTTLHLSALQVEVLQVAAEHDGAGVDAETLRSLGEPSRLRAAVLHLRRYGFLGRLEIGDESMVPTRLVISDVGRRLLAQCRTAR